MLEVMLVIIQEQDQIAEIALETNLNSKKGSQSSFFS